MTCAPDVQRRLRAFLDAVETQASDRPAAARADLRRQLESHICEALRQRGGDAPTLDDLETVLAGMDPPDTYGVALPEATPRAPAPAAPSRRDLKWFALAVCFLLLNGWMAWQLVSHREARPAPPAAARATPRPQPLRLLAVEQASYNGDDRTAVLALTFNAAPVPQQLERFVRVSREEHADENIRCEAVGAVATPHVRVRVRDAVDSGDHLIVTVFRGLTATEAEVPAMESDQHLTVAIANRFQVGALEPSSPPFEPCRLQVSFGKTLDATDAASFIAVQPAVKLDVSSDWRGCAIAGDFQPGTPYTFTFRQGLKAVDNTRLAADAERRVIFPDREAALSFATEGVYLSPRGALNVPVLAMNVHSCSVALRRLRPENIVFHANGHNGNLTDPAVSNVVSLAERPNREHKFYVDLRTLADAQPTGVYQLTVTALQPRPRESWQRIEAERLVVVTDLGLSLKHGRDGVLAWVTALRTAQPAADAEVVLYARNNMELARGRTDAQGLLFLPCRANVPEEQRPALATARQGDDLVYLKLEGATAPEDCAGDAYLHETCEAFVFTDRGIYRPGETAHVEALVRDGQLNPPAPFPVLLRVVKPDGRVFRDLPATLNTRGGATFAVDLPAYLPSGRYDLRLVMPGTFAELGHASAALEEFAPPQIAVTLAPLPARVAAASATNLTAQISARHLFGRPAAGLPASASVYLHDTPFRPDGWKDFTFGDAEKPALKQSLPLGETRLDAEGRASFTLPAIGAVRPAGALQATVCATVRDTGGRAVSAYASTGVDAYPFYLGLRPSDGSTHARVGAPFALTIAAVTPDAHAWQPDTPLLATVERVEWTSALRRSNGHDVWQSDRTRIRIGEPIRITLHEGAGTFAFTAQQSGSYLVTLADPFSGTSASLPVFAASDADGGSAWTAWDRTKPAQAKLTLDRPAYAPGATARLAVQAPFAGTALLTIESDRILDQRVVTLAANTATFDVDVKASYAPNVHCVLSVIRPAVAESVWSAHRALGSVVLKVVPPGHSLTVAVSAPPLIQPQSPLTATVHVTDESSAPAAGAEIVACAVDEGICMLTDYATPDPLAYFLRTRGLGVAFDDLYRDLLPISEDTSDATVSHVAGDTGALVGRRLNPIRARRFKPVALWQAGALTDAHGEATVTFDVPEFAGELRLTAVAFGPSTFGAAKAAVTVKRTLVVQAELPRFLAPGDSCRLGLSLFNETNAACTAAWRVTCGGPLVADRASGALTLAPHGATNAAIELRAGSLPGQASCSIEVVADAMRYAETFELAVRPTLAAETRCAEGVLKPGATTRVTAPAEWLAGSAYYDVSVSSQPDVKLAGALGWLLRYPYGCCEQTASAAFPLLVLADLANRNMPQAMGAIDAAPYVAAAIDRLLSMQREDGSFAMWPDVRQSDPWAGIYATHFLVEARRAGHAVPADRLNAALDSLAHLLEQHADAGDRVQADRAYICQVLALAGRPERGWTARLLDQAGELSTADRAHLAAALLADGKPREARTLLDGLETSVAPAANTEERTSEIALALAAWVDSDPADAAVPRLVHALEGLRVRDRGWWGTTRANALALLALGRYARLTKPDHTPFAGELQPEGGSPLPFASDRELHWHSREPGATPSLRLDNRGPGSCWYTARLEGVPVDGTAQPVDAGLAVRRAFFDQEGHALDVSRVRQGALIVVKLTLDTRGETIDNLVVEDLLPAGWEIENPALATAKVLPWVEAKTEWCIHRELRDDRVLLFTGSVCGKAVYFYTARAVTPGRFALPPVRAEAMYRPEVHSLNGAAQVEVTE